MWDPWEKFCINILTQILRGMLSLNLCCKRYFSTGANMALCSLIPWLICRIHLTFAPYFSYMVKVATMTHFCTFGTVTHVLVIGFGRFFLIDRFRSQAALVQVSSTLLTLTTLGREWNVKTFFVYHGGKSRATMTHPLATMTHIWKAM